MAREPRLIRKDQCNHPLSGCGVVQALSLAIFLSGVGRSGLISNTDPAIKPLIKKIMGQERKREREREKEGEENDDDIPRVLQREVLFIKWALGNVSSIWACQQLEEEEDFKSSRRYQQHNKGKLLRAFPIPVCVRSTQNSWERESSSSSWLCVCVCWRRADLLLLLLFLQWRM